MGTGVFVDSYMVWWVIRWVGCWWVSHQPSGDSTVKLPSQPKRLTILPFPIQQPPNILTYQFASLRISQFAYQPSEPAQLINILTYLPTNQLTTEARSSSGRWS